MTENDGLDVIVQASATAPVSPRRACPVRRAVRFQQTGHGTWKVDTGAGLRRALGNAVATNQTNPTASPVGGLLTLCVAGGRARRCTAR